LIKKNAGRNRWQLAILALGVSICLIGALIMIVGEPILGEDHTGIATVVGIVGIGLIASSSQGVPKRQNHQQREVC
jgi:O-antigen/teichoic acid export membrane protein